MDVDPLKMDTTLAEFEARMSAEDIQLFQQRYENNYDLDLDPLYIQWKSLKDKAGGLAMSMHLQLVP